MSKLEVDAIEPQSGTTLTLGASGDTVNIASGATITDFTSTGIDDNATSTAITIDSSENVSFAKNISTGNNGVLNILDADGDISGKLANQSSSAHSLEIIADPSNSGANSNMIFKIDNSEHMRIDSSGHAIIPAGVTLGTAAGTYNAANTLDDYEVGDWTPVLGAYGGTPTINNSHYIKIGKLVMASTRILLDGTSDASNFQIAGLPFTCKNTTNDVFGAIIGMTTSTVTRINILVNRNNTDAYLYNNDGSIMSYNTFGNDKQIRLSIIYQTD